MGERPTAEHQLARILDMLPRAARDGGISLAELAEIMETDQRGVLRDLQEVYTRTYYHPAGSGEDVQLLIDSEQVEVWTTGEFRRPVRLNPREALALGLGLRILAAESSAPARAEQLALADRLEARLSRDGSEAMLRHFAAGSAMAPAESVRSVLGEAAATRRRCRISYLKPGAAEPEVREIDPYVLLIAGGRWYTVGHCHGSRDVRIFRLDRMVEATPLENTFVVRDGFDPGAYVSDGRVYRAGEDVEVVVRYSARIARWIEEQGAVERAEGGAVVVRYRVADPQWIVRHVLEHGPDAELLAPAEMREQVIAALARIRR